MKLNELRIGNFVYHKAVWSYRQKYEPFIEFQFAWNESDWFAIGDCTLMEENIEFITITEEWLLKFGFQIKLDNFNWNAAIGVNEIGDFKLSLRHTDDFGWFYKSRCTPIKHVHQLQNLYFALTGEELICDNGQMKK